MLLLGVFTSACLGFALLALSQQRHWCRVAATDPPHSGNWIRRLTGAVLLAISLVLALLRDGPSFGALLWATAISVAALVVTLMLGWRPRWLRPLAIRRR